MCTLLASLSALLNWRVDQCPGFDLTGSAVAGVRSHRLVPASRVAVTDTPALGEALLDARKTAVNLFASIESQGQSQSSITAQFSVVWPSGQTGAIILQVYCDQDTQKQISTSKFSTWLQQTMAPANTGISGFHELVRTQFTQSGKRSQTLCSLKMTLHLLIWDLCLGTSKLTLHARMCLVCSLSHPCQYRQCESCYVEVADK